MVIPPGSDLHHALVSHPEWFDEPGVIRRRILLRMIVALDGNPVFALSGEVHRTG